jgi:hypothetical protein
VRGKVRDLNDQQVVPDKVAQEARNASSAFVRARQASPLAGEMVLARKDAEKSSPGAALLKAKGDTAKAELDALKAEIAYRVAQAQLAGLVCAE